MVIDLKNVDVWMTDGTALEGAINLMAGYIVGSTTFTVDGFVGSVPDGALMLLDGVIYEVVSATDTMGNTTSITIASPGLLVAAVDDDPITVYGNSIRIKVGEGNLTWSEKKPREYKKDRGRLDTIRDADEEPMDVSFTMNYEFITASSGDPPTPEDALKQRGEAADWVSADVDDPCAPYCVNILLLHTPPNCTTIEKELVILPTFYYESLDHDPKAGTIQAAGKCNALEATVSRV